LRPFSGWSAREISSEPTFSRAFAEFAQDSCPGKSVKEALNKEKFLFITR